MIDVEAVQLRSYFLWEKDGKPSGRELEYWFRAESEIAEEQSGAKAAKVSRATKPKSKPTGKPKATRK